jgi:transcriptional regulator with XRE-family HTH domain
MNFAYMKPVHIGKQIKEVFEKRGYTVAEFARRINMSRENVYSIFKRKTIDTGLLLNISKVLEHDFFVLYLTLNTDINKELERLKEENRLLREVNLLLKRNNKM